MLDMIGTIHQQLQENALTDYVRMSHFNQPSLENDYEHEIWFSGRNYPSYIRFNLTITCELTIDEGGYETWVYPISMSMYLHKQSSPLETVFFGTLDEDESGVRLIEWIHAFMEQQYHHVGYHMHAYLADLLDLTTERGIMDIHTNEQRIRLLQIMAANNMSDMEHAGARMYYEMVDMSAGDLYDHEYTSMREQNFFWHICPYAREYDTDLHSTIIFGLTYDEDSLVHYPKMLPYVGEEWESTYKWTYMQKKQQYGYLHQDDWKPAVFMHAGHYEDIDPQASIIFPPRFNPIYDVNVSGISRLYDVERRGFSESLTNITETYEAVFGVWKISDLWAPVIYINELQQFAFMYDIDEVRLQKLPSSYYHDYLLYQEDVSSEV